MEVQKTWLQIDLTPNVCEYGRPLFLPPSSAAKTEKNTEMTSVIGLYQRVACQSIAWRLEGRSPCNLNLKDDPSTFGSISRACNPARDCIVVARTLGTTEFLVAN